MENSVSQEDRQLHTQLYFSGDDYFSDVIHAIKNANTLILAESYIFNLDPIGISILQALIEAKNKGVKVHLLIDGIGSYNWLPQIVRECTNHGISFRIYHPIPFEVKILSRFSWTHIKWIISLFRRINRRNHRKVFIIDQKCIFLGSINISQVHSERFMGEKAWRDVAVKMSTYHQSTRFDPALKAFYQAWNKSKYFFSSNAESFRRQRLSKGKVQNALLRLNHNPYIRFLLYRDLKSRIKKAKDEILIANAYFLPRQGFLRNLIQASRRGVKVQVMVPQTPDVWIVGLAAQYLFTKLLRHHIDVYEYIPQMLHAKFTIIDEWSVVGSQNLNHRSFIHDLEIETPITDPELLRQLKGNWKEMLKHCRKVNSSQLGNSFFKIHILGRFFYWFRYWL